MLKRILQDMRKILKIKNILLNIAVLFLCLTLLTCSNNPIDAVYIVNNPNHTDYSKAEHWLAVPTSISRPVDVFYLYPTAWTKVAGDSNICKIDNPSMLIGAPLAFNRQATAFSTVGNIYAPYYRQVDIFYRMSLPPSEQEKVVSGIPTADAISAFDYYIKHYNKGRPFILAGHSQGSNVLIYLLSEYMRLNPQVYERMIAAYVIGYSITPEYLAKNPHLKFAQGSDDIGVIISYNTESPDVVPGTNVVTLPGGIAINPITWTRDETLAPASKNLGSIVLNSNGTVAAGIPNPVMNFADARVDKAKGVIICSTVDVNKWSPGNVVFVKGVFHSFDYPFYYYNLRANAANRVSKYLGR